VRAFAGDVESELGGYLLTATCLPGATATPTSEPAVLPPSGTGQGTPSAGPVLEPWLVLLLLGVALPCLALGAWVRRARR